MRFIPVLSALLITSAIVAGGCQTTQRTSGGGANQAFAAETDPIETSTATLTVHGMGCPLCANNVDKQLLAVQGVRQVDVNLGSGEVTVHVDEANAPSKSQLARAVHQSGFTLVRIDTP